MKLFNCQSCGQILHFENGACLGCGQSVGYLAEENRMLSLAPEGPIWREAPPAQAHAPAPLPPADAGLAVSPLTGTELDGPTQGEATSGGEDRAEGARPAAELGFSLSALGLSGPAWRFCKNWEASACNWLIALPEDGSPAPAFCPACRHNRTIPDLSNPEHRAQWQKIEIAKRRLIYSLIRLGLPLPQAGEGQPEPLIFDFLANDPEAGEKVMTGHADGVITISLDEADDVARETLRSQLGEAYRTLLGHFRHEVGHYYWDILVRNRGHLDGFRALFGDERADYGAALQRHYTQGAPANWQQNFVSSYATMHPWEDWAETWAHYLHILDTLETAAAFGMEMRPRVDAGGDLTARIDFSPYRSPLSDDLLSAWMPLTVALNSLNRSMGQSDLYPFTLTGPVRQKFDYVHRLVSGQIAAPQSPPPGHRQPPGIAPATGI